jgi:hypothetical protein
MKTKLQIDQTTSHTSDFIEISLFAAIVVCLTVRVLQLF